MGNSIDWNKYVRLSFVFLLLLTLVPVTINGQVKVAWENIYTSGTGDDYDSGQAITTDANGNVYVAGFSPSQDGTKRELIVIKYDENGNQIWEGRVGNFDWYSVSEIAVDLNYNVYVASQSESYFNLVKFRSDGNPQWQRHSATVLGHAKDILLHNENGSGEDPNIIVTGWRADAMATIKYNADGSLLWSDYYDPGFGVSEGTAISFAGNEYVVTGSSTNSAGNRDYMTIRYDRNGNIIWEKRYDGSAGAGDYARDVAVYTIDGFDYFTVVTGYSRGTGGIDDCTTVLYDNDGNQLWDRRYYDFNNTEKDNPNSICNKVYARGSSILVTSRSGDDIATIKYDSQGNQLWDRRYASEGGFVEIGYDLFVDSENSVYVLGRSEAENLEDYTYTIIKYNSNGTQTWVKHYNAAGEGGIPALNGLAVERLSGRKVYVTGNTSSGDGDIATLVYVDEGPDFANLQWPPNGNIIEGGEYLVYGQAWLAYLGESPTKNDYLGEMLAWIGVNEDNTDPSTWDESAWIPADFNVMVGNNGEYFLDIGSSRSPGTHYYATRYGIFYPTDNGGSIESFSYGGYSENGGGYWDGVTNISGVLTINKDPEDPNLANNNSFQYFGLGELSDGGVNSWSFNATANGASATIEVIDESQDDDLRALKINNGAFNGNEEWNVEAVSEGLQVKEGITYQASVWLKADNGLRVARIYLGLPESGGWVRLVEETVNLSSNWTKFSISHTASAIDETNTMRLGVAFNYSENANGVLYIDNVEVLDEASIVSNEINIDNPISFSLNQNYPNPFNPSTQISYQLSENGIVTLKVFDMLGREVATLINEVKQAGSYTLDFDASELSSGIYIYQLQAGSNIETKKMMLVK